MAKRRCISVDVFDSDIYLDLSNDAKALYTSLILHSDDEGVVINHQTVMRLLGSKPEDVEELTKAGFLIKIGEVYIIRHWYVHNKVQPSRMVESLYKTELSALELTQTKEYRLAENSS